MKEGWVWMKNDLDFKRFGAEIVISYIFMLVTVQRDQTWLKTLGANAL